MSRIRKAERRKLKARIMLFGPAGGGKTYTGLQLALAIAGEGRVLMIDTESHSDDEGRMVSSGDKYAHLGDFDVYPLLHAEADPKALRAIVESEALGYDTLFIDGLTPAWDWVQAQADANMQLGFQRWNRPKKVLRDLTDALLAFPGNVIVTTRGVMKYEVGQDSKGKQSIEKLGVGQQFEKNFEYEMDIVASIDAHANLHVVKSRMAEIADETIRHADRKLGLKIKAWLDGGASVVEKTLKRIREATTLDELEAVLSEAREAVKRRDMSKGDARDIGVAAETARARLAPPVDEPAEAEAVA